jgi:hypothetical protein
MQNTVSDWVIEYHQVVYKFLESTGEGGRVTDVLESLYDDAWEQIIVWWRDGVSPADAAQQTIDRFAGPEEQTPPQQFPVLEYPDQDELDYERRAEG